MLGKLGITLPRSLPFLKFLLVRIESGMEINVWNVQKNTYIYLWCSSSFYRFNGYFFFFSLCIREEYKANDESYCRSTLLWNRMCISFRQVIFTFEDLFLTLLLCFLPWHFFFVGAPFLETFLYITLRDPHFFLQVAPIFVYK